VRTGASRSGRPAAIAGRNRCRLADARALADAYNQRLRRRLGLPPAPRRALLRDVTLTPYVAVHDAGAVLEARF
jgi:hypothetical protein